MSLVVLGRKGKDALFFDAFSAHAELGVRAAKMLAAMFARMTPADAGAAHPYRRASTQSGNDGEIAAITGIASEIKVAEREGDRLKREAMKRLRENWVTPLDRADILDLVHGMDDVLDHIDGVAERLSLFHVTVVPPDAVELAGLLVSSCEALAVAIGAIGKMKKLTVKEILEHCNKVNQLETAADAVHRRAMGELFTGGNDPLEVMKWRDLYDGLESATDCCEDVADVIEGVALEYA